MRMLLLSCLLLIPGIRAADKASNPLRAISGYTFYTTETEGAVLLLGDQVKDWIAEGPCLVDLACSGKQWRVSAEARADYLIVRFPLASLPLGATHMACTVRHDSRILGRAEATIQRLPPKANAVAIDRETGCVITGGLPSIPVGFYCYSPVQETLAEEEVVRGFTMMSPYQSNRPATRGKRREYMDRCAALGMRVHYQLLAVAGGGGVYGARGSDAQEEALRQEVRAFRDHPALLAWYISDEPTGHGTGPEKLARIRRIIHEEDPYHPVTVVFMRPSRARAYADGLDVVMVDPYPIPVRPPTSAGNAVARVFRDLAPEKTVWMVPQCFGGNEHWTREPTAREMRLMGYLGIVEGARGLQHFIRHGLQGFPKSPTLWAECSRMALEINQAIPYIASHEAAPAISTAPETIRAAAWRDRGRVLVIAVNTLNQPQKLTLTLDGVFSGTPARVLYEQRTAPIRPHYPAPPPKKGLLSRLRFWQEDRPAPVPVGITMTDTIDAFGVRFYRFAVGEDSAPKYSFHPNNLIVDPSFEREHFPGIPEATYAKVGAGRGATYFLDARVALDGRHALRLITPAAGQGVAIQPFKPRVRAGDAYQFSLWAKAAPGPPQRLSLRAGTKATTVTLTDQWQRFTLACVAPKARNRKLFLQFRLETAGTAWVDALECIHLAPLVSTSGGGNQPFLLHLDRIPDGATVRYTIDGSKPTRHSPLYTAPLPITRSITLKGCLWSHDVASPVFSVRVRRHDANGCIPTLTFPYSKTYKSRGPGSLTDGLIGEPDTLYGAWQGFVKDDLDAVIDLGRSVPLREVRGRFLQNAHSWIWLPSRFTVSASEDGSHYRPVGSVTHSIPLDRKDPFTHELTVSGDNQPARYIRVQAANLGVCPAWHAGAGQDCWLFADEIMVNPKN